MDQRLALLAAGIAGRGRKLRQNALSNQLGVAADADADRLGQADAVGVDIDLDDLGVLRPVVDAIARKGRERVEPGAERQHHVGLGDQFHPGLRAVIAERTDGQRMAAWEAVVMLVVVADRRIEPLGQRDAFLNRVSEHDAGARQDDREFRRRQQLRRFRDRLGAAGRTLELDDRRQVDVDDLRPVVARDVDLRRRRQTLGLGDHAIEHLGNTRGIAHFFLIADHVAEQRHLLHFLEAALTDCFVRRLRRHQQHRRMVPVCGLDRRDEVGDARAVLRDRHGDLAGGARIAVADQRAVALVRDVPERDAGLGKQVRNRHEGRTNDAESMFDAVHLQYFHEGFFRRHLHSCVLFPCSAKFVAGFFQSLA